MSELDLGTKIAAAYDVAKLAIADLTKQLSEKEAQITKLSTEKPAAATPEYRSALQGLVDQLVESGLSKSSEAERLVGDGIASPAAILRNATSAIREHEKRASATPMGGPGPAAGRGEGDSIYFNNGDRTFVKKGSADELWERTYGTKRG